MQGDLDADQKLVGGQPPQMAVGTGDFPGVARAHRRHNDNLPLDQLHPLLRGQDTHFCHPVVFGYRELADFRDLRLRGLRLRGKGGNRGRGYDRSGRRRGYRGRGSHSLTPDFGKD